MVTKTKTRRTRRLCFECKQPILRTHKYKWVDKANNGKKVHVDCKDPTLMGSVVGNAADDTITQTDTNPEGGTVTKGQPIIASARATQVVRDRRQQYGDPNSIYGRVASMWGEILSTTVTPQQVALCMIALKLGRESVRPNEDNRTDICGYTNVYEMLNGGDSD